MRLHFHITFHRRWDFGFTRGESQFWLALGFVTIHLMREGTCPLDRS